MNTLRVVSVGLGPIGLAAAELVTSRRSLSLVGAVDIDPDKRDRDLGEFLGRDERLGVVIEGDLAAALGRLRPDAVLLCTGSHLPEVSDQILAILAAGANIVSSCEELLLPELQHPALAHRLDAAARAAGVTVVGTGVNPGFVLDFIPVVASAVCREVRAVRGLRVVDAGTRRLPLQRKVGAGMAPDEFRRLAEAGRLGHVGMRESVALVGRALHLELDVVRQTIEPVVAESEVRTPFLMVRPGQVAGIRNLGIGERRGTAVVELDLRMYVGAGDPRDEVHLEGDPPIDLRFTGGLPGDQATAAILVNTVRSVVEGPPGLRTVLDIAPPRLAL